jgi:metallo-beta-lactamase class B
MKPLLFLLSCLALSAQAPPGVSDDIKHWYEPTSPAHIAGPIHYVGTKGLCVYLIQTADGLILVDGAMPQSAPLIEASIRKLGFDPKDIRLILATHAHVDHAGTLAYFQKLSNAKVAAMPPDIELLASGGKADYLFAARPFFHFEPVRATVVLKDRGTLVHGGVTISTFHTPGHTRGGASYALDITDNGKTYKVLFPCSTSINPGTRLVRNPSYPGIADDYRRSIRFLASLTPDIFLPAHVESFDFADKAARAKSEGARAFVDPTGYRRWITQQQTNFDAALKQETSR